jgi:hypothetical protein
MVARRREWYLLHKSDSDMSIVPPAKWIVSSLVRLERSDVKDRAAAPPSMPIPLGGGGVV